MAETEPTTETWRNDMPGDEMADDISARFVVSDRQRNAAVALLEALPERFTLCYVPIALVNKRRMFWNKDVIVEHEHAYFPSTNRGDERPNGRDLAEQAAFGTLNGRVGTTAYGAVWRDGKCAVFEGMLRVTRKGEED